MIRAILCMTLGSLRPSLDRADLPTDDITLAMIAILTTLFDCASTVVRDWRE
jgi:hypothetical protein